MMFFFNIVHNIVHNNNKNNEKGYMKKELTYKLWRNQVRQLNS